MLTLGGAPAAVNCATRRVPTCRGLSKKKPALLWRTRAGIGLWLTIPVRFVGMIDATVGDTAGNCPLDGVARAEMSQFITAARGYTPRFEFPGAFMDSGVWRLDGAEAHGLWATW